MQHSSIYLKACFETLGRFSRIPDKMFGVILSNNLTKIIPYVVFGRLQTITLREFLSCDQLNNCCPSVLGKVIDLAKG